MRESDSRPLLEGGIFLFLIAPPLLLRRLTLNTMGLEYEKLRR
jgi:hypothetical protein